MNQLLINVVGHNGSGKSTVSTKLSTALGINRVNGDAFRKFIAENITYFNDLQVSYPNEKYKLLNPLTVDYRLKLTGMLLSRGQSVIYDGSGSTKQYRQELFEMFKPHFAELKNIIIYCEIGEAALRERLDARDKDMRDNRWNKMYDDIKSKTFEPPTMDECDTLLTYTQNNYDEIKKALKELLV